jgi:hypothetical protein
MKFSFTLGPLSCVSKLAVVAEQRLRNGDNFRSILLDGLGKTTERNCCCILDVVQFRINIISFYCHCIYRICNCVLSVKVIMTINLKFLATLMLGEMVTPEPLYYCHCCITSITRNCPNLNNNPESLNRVIFATEVVYSLLINFCRQLLAVRVIYSVRKDCNI